MCISLFQSSGDAAGLANWLKDDEKWLFIDGISGIL